MTDEQSASPAPWLALCHQTSVTDLADKELGQNPSGQLFEAVLVQIGVAEEGGPAAELEALFGLLDPFALQQQIGKRIDRGARHRGRRDQLAARHRPVFTRQALQQIQDSIGPFRTLHEHPSRRAL